MHVKDDARVRGPRSGWPPLIERELGVEEGRSLTDTITQDDLTGS